MSWLAWKAREFKQSAVWMGEAASLASVFINGIVPQVP